MSAPRKRPRDRAGWEETYQEGTLPWDTGEPDPHLRAVVAQYGIQPGRALEIGCGTGTNAIWLARQGFDVVATDISTTAIAKAREKVAAAGVTVELAAVDFLQEEVPPGPFDFVYDRGCLHVFDEAAQRARFAARVAERLAPDGLWHSLIGSTDGPPRDSGPPRRSAAEIVTAVEPHCEILELRATEFDPVRRPDVRAWVLVARRRRVYGNQGEPTEAAASDE